MFDKAFLAVTCCVLFLAADVRLSARSALGYCIKCEDWVEIYHPSKYCPKCGKKILDSWPPD